MKQKRTIVPSVVKKGLYNVVERIPFAPGLTTVKTVAYWGTLEQAKIFSALRSSDATAWPRERRDSR